MEQPNKLFLARAKGILQKAVSIRLKLIANNTSNKRVTFDTCKDVERGIEMITNTRQMAEFLVRNRFIIHSIAPTSHLANLYSIMGEAAFLYVPNHQHTNDKSS